MFEWSSFVAIGLKLSVLLLCLLRDRISVKKCVVYNINVKLDMPLRYFVKNIDLLDYDNST